MECNLSLTFTLMSIFGVRVVVDGLGCATTVPVLVVTDDTVVVAATVLAFTCCSIDGSFMMRGVDS